DWWVSYLMKFVKKAKQLIRSTVTGGRGAEMCLDADPIDPTLETLEVLGSVRDLQKACCELALQNHPGLDWAEFGVSRGWSASFFLELLPKSNRLFLFDSWEGLPESWEKVPEGQYRVPVPDFRDGRAHLIKGLFEET